MADVQARLAGVDRPDLARSVEPVVEGSMVRVYREGMSFFIFLTIYKPLEYARGAGRGLLQHDVDSSIPSSGNSRSENFHSNPGKCSGFFFRLLTGKLIRDHSVSGSSRIDFSDPEVHKLQSPICSNAGEKGFPSMTKRKSNIPLSGFPRKGMFKSKEEVDAYFASEKIQCLLCGRWFEHIGGTHMIRKHGISADEYREMYGLPWGRGLSGKRNREKRIKQGKKYWGEGITSDMEQVRRKARKARRRPPQPYQRDYYSKTLSASRVSKPKYGREDMAAVLDRMRKQQRSLRDVCQDPDAPSLPTVKHFAKKHPEFEEKIKRTYYSLPPKLQVGSGYISPRLEMMCKRMLTEGMSLGKITKALDLSFPAVKKILQRDPEGLRLLEDRAPTRWGDEDFERILDRVRIEQRIVHDVCGDPDLPSFAVFVRYVRKHPEFKEKVKQAYYTLPYSLQVKARVVSPRFNVDCQRLRATGMRVKKIGRALGVSFDPVKRVLEESPEGFRPLLVIGSSKWRPEDYEALLDRMEKEQRTLKDVCGDPDLPSIASWRLFKRKHPGFVEKHRRVVFSQPYQMQIEAGVISPGLLREVKRLGAKGLTSKAISEKLGIGQNEVEMLARKARKRPPAGRDQD